METKDREHRIYFVTLMGSVVNVVLLVFKFMAGILGGSALLVRLPYRHRSGVVREDKLKA